MDDAKTITVLLNDGRVDAAASEARLDGFGITLEFEDGERLYPWHTVRQILWDGKRP